MTDEELKAIEARAGAATPGPWEVDCTLHPDDGESQGIVYGRDAHGRLSSQEIIFIGDPATAAFVGNARLDVPALVAEVRRLRGVLGEMAKGGGALGASRESWQEAAFFTLNPDAPESASPLAKK